MQKTVNSEKSRYQPLIFNLLSDVDKASFQDMISRKNPTLIDTIDDQLRDLAACNYPHKYMAGENIDALVEAYLGGKNKNDVGNWVYFSWKNCAVRVLDKSEFITVRTNRNKLKIKPETQLELRTKNILFIGLSVGQSAALTFAMQGIGGFLYLADFDTLSLSNMNRLRASIADIGINKSTIAARQIAEQDPYLNITCIDTGINFENIDAILTKNGTGNIDLIVEECDNLEMKFLVREKAREYGIPVIMETSDRGVLDVERFDLEPDLPLLHGLAGNVSYSDILGFSKAERFEVLTKIVDYSKISEGLKQSYAALGTEVLTWPQLGYEVTLGGATLACAAGIILSGKSIKSGRYYVDLESVFEQHK